VDIEYSTFVKRLKRVRNIEKVNSLIAGVVRFCVWLMVVTVFFLTLDWIFQFNSISRAIVDGCMILVLAISAVINIGLPLFDLLIRKNLPSIDSIAIRIGIHFPEIHDRLVNAIQIYRNHLINQEQYASTLVFRTMENAHTQTIDVDFSEIVNRKNITRGITILAMVSAFSFIVLISFRNTYLHSLERLLHPNKNYQHALPFTLTVTPGNIQILKDENVDIKVNSEGIAPTTVQLHIRNVATGYEFVNELANRKNQFLFTLERLKDSTQYFITAANYRSPMYAIQVIEIPMIRHLEVQLTFPSYTKMESRFLDDNVGDITALKGTKANLHIEANKQLSQAYLLFNNASPIPLQIKGSMAEGMIRINHNDTYRIQLTDRAEFESRDPIEYRIQALEDNPPLIRIVQPGEDVDIAENMQLPIEIEAEDDFGFTDIILSYRLTKSEFSNDTTRHSIKMAIANPDEEKILVSYPWDLTSLNLFPEDVVTYYAVVRDNDNISGPKSAQSATYHIRFPSINELYTDMEKEHETAFESVEGMYEQSKELKEKLSDLVQEMKKDPNLKWEEQKQLEDVMTSQQNLQKTLEEVEQQLDEMVQQMEKNDLTSVETLKKYMELQNLLQEMMTDEMKQAMQQLQDAMQNVDPEQLKQAVENLDISQKEFLKNIEKTLSLLKRLYAEQKLDEAIKKASTMMEQQNEINEKASENNKSMNDQLAGEQQKLEQESDALNNDLSQLQQTMSEFSDMPTMDVKNAQDTMQDQRLSDNMDQAKQQFQQGNFQQGQKFGQKSQQTLSQMTASLQMAKENMLQQQKQQLMAEMRRMNNDLLQLSKKQEEVMESGKEMNSNSSHIEEMADLQQDLVNGLQPLPNQAGNMENKSFFMSPQISKSIGNSLIQMQEAITNIEARNMPGASQDQGHAMASINEAVKQIRQSMQQLSAAQSASGLEEMMQQMSKMSQQQQGINQQTMQLGMGQSLSMQQQAAMARLAAQQAALKKSMEQLAQEYGDRSDVLGDLNQIAKDMNDVAKDLQSQQVTRQTYNQQRRILSRLLDAQKSMQRREYSQKRKAETGKYYLAKSPGLLPSDLGERDMQFRQDILKSTKEGYTKDYQELIKKYFEALVHDENDKNN
jgi:hypothetical protein